VGTSRWGVPAFVRLAGHSVRWQLLAELARSDLRVRELAELVGEPQNLVSYHLRLLREGGLVSANRSSFDGRDSYYHLELERCAEALADTGTALHPALSREGTVPAADGQRRLSRLTVLFVCTGNSARSPIAEGLLRRRAGGRLTVLSAGSRPKAQLHPDAVRVLRQDFDIDVAAQRPRRIETLTGHRFDYVITLCDKAREVCPEFDGAPRRVHWSVPDPAAAADVGEAGYPAFLRTATDIDTRVRHLLPVLATTHPQEVVP
jgi:protein-tyrosine-phosphatase